MDGRICQQCGLLLKVEKKFKVRIANRSGFATYICSNGHRESLKNHTAYEERELQLYQKARIEKTNSHHKK